MEPTHLRFGGGSPDTLIHPLVAGVALIALIAILCLSRKHASAALLLGAFLIPVGQVVVLGGIHFTVLRILILAGLIRAVTSKEKMFHGGFNSLDWFVTLWACSALIVISLQYMQLPAVIKNMGDFLDALGGYYVVRFLIRTTSDMRWVVKVFAAVAVVSAVCMINEQITHQNVFGLLGGVQLTPQIRAGSARSQAAFGVYIEAGEFGAILVPLLVWLWSDKRSRIAACVGMIGASGMVLTSHSSTPLLALAAGILGFCLWPLRRRMRIVRYGLVSMLIALHLVMNGPVWALIGRVDLTGSSSGFHRYYLVDCTIRHFSDWWLLGYRDFDKWGWDMWDLSNHYVSIALTGGLISLVFFLGILARGFGGLGTARKRVSGQRKQEWLFWCLGSALFAHIVGWFGCSYMAQMYMTLFPLLAMISEAVGRGAPGSPGMKDSRHVVPSGDAESVALWSWKGTTSAQFAPRRRKPSVTAFASLPARARPSRKRNAACSVRWAGTSLPNMLFPSFPGLPGRIFATRAPLRT